MNSDGVKIPTRELLGSLGRLEYVVTRIVTKAKINNSIEYTHPWIVVVKCISLGKEDTIELLFQSEKERDSIAVGYRFSNHSPGG